MAKKGNSDIFKILEIVIENLTEGKQNTDSTLTLVKAMNQQDLMQFSREITNNPNSVNEKDAYGATPLHYSVGHDFSYTKTLVEQKADINSGTHKKGLTPIMLAIYVNNAQVAEFLIKQGAKISFNEALSFAVETGNKEIFKEINNRNENERKKMQKTIEDQRAEITRKETKINTLEQNLEDALNQLKGCLSTNLDVVNEAVKLGGNQHIIDEEV